MYANPFPFPRDLDALYSGTEGYFENLEGRDDAAFETPLKMIEDLTPGRRLLEVGAGQGNLVAMALRRGWDAWGIESASAFAEAANRRCPGRVFHGSIEEAPDELVREPFDAVILAAVLEHLHHPTRVLAAIARVLKPGGVLYLDVPNESGLFYLAGNLWERLRGSRAVVQLSPTFPPYHVFGFTPGALDSMLRSQGLEPAVWKFYAGVSTLPLQRSLRGAVEWAGSRVVHAASGLGQLGNTMVVLSRRAVSAR